MFDLFLYFSLSVLRGSYHDWICFTFSRGLQQIEDLERGEERWGGREKVCHKLFVGLALNASSLVTILVPHVWGKGAEIGGFPEPNILGCQF